MMYKRGGEELLDATPFQAQSLFARRVTVVVREEIAKQGMPFGSFARTLDVSEEKAAEILAAKSLSFDTMARLCLAVGLEPGPALEARVNAVELPD